MTNEYRNIPTNTLLFLLASNKNNLRTAKDTMLFRDDVDTFLYNIETITAELVRREVGV